MDPDGRIYETAWDVLSIIVDMGFAIYYQLSGNTEAANDALFDAQCDLIAALIPGYIAGLSKIRYLADVSSINKIKLSYLDDVLSPEDFSKISHMERGRLNEKRVLEAAGLQKNTKKYHGQTRKHGIRDVIPDAVTDNAFIEVKDVKKLNNSPQIEAELDAAIKEGKQFFIITGENTTIAPIIKNNPQINIIQIKGIGPK